MSPSFRADKLSVQTQRQHNDMLFREPNHSFLREIFGNACVRPEESAPLLSRGPQSGARSCWTLGLLWRLAHLSLRPATVCSPAARVLRGHPVFVLSRLLFRRGEPEFKLPDTLRGFKVLGI